MASEAAVFALIRRRAGFRRLFLAHSISRAGDAFNTVALVVLVFDLTGSGLGVAGAVAFEILPILLLGPILGLAVDRYPRRTLMVVADLARAMLALLIALRPDSVVLAYSVAFGLSAFTQLFTPAASSVLPELVEPDELVDANVALWTVAVLVQILLAPLAGVLIGLYGPTIAFAANAASYLLSAVLLRGLTVGAPAGPSGEQGWRASLAGLATVRRDPLLSRLAIVQLLAALSAGATGGLLVVLAGDRLHVGPTGFGLLLGAIGLGAALGPLLLRRFIRACDRRWLFGPYALRGGADLVLAVATSPTAAMPALLLYGLGTSTGMVAYQSTLQRVVASELRGRTFALFDVLWNGTRLLSLGLGGIVADRYGVQVVYLLGATLLFSAFVIGWSSRWPSNGKDRCSGHRGGS